MKVPSTVTLIGVSAFSSCVRLEKIELQEGIEEIGGFAFYACKSLKRIHIPTTIKAIGGHAFYWTPLLSIDLPDGMESIGAYSFVYTVNSIDSEFQSVSRPYPRGNSQV